MQLLSPANLFFNRRRCATNGVCWYILRVESLFTIVIRSEFRLKLFKWNFFWTTKISKWRCTLSLRLPQDRNMYALCEIPSLSLWFQVIDVPDKIMQMRLMCIELCRLNRWYGCGGAFFLNTEVTREFRTEHTCPAHAGFTKKEVKDNELLLVL